MSFAKLDVTMEQFITDQLLQKGIQIGHNSSGSDWMQVFCVEGHDHKTPSLSINKKTGGFKCFGCGIKGRSWNDLARKIGAAIIGEDEGPDPFKALNSELTAEEKKSKEKTHELPWDLMPWTGPWRDVGPKLLGRLNARKWYDDRLRCYRILFPVTMYKKLEGWVARRLDKVDEMKYRNSPGLEVTQVLFPFDFVRRMSPKVVALVEGPFDAIRLLNEGIPALSVLGSGNYHADKRIHLLNIGVRRVVLLPDGDTAGDKMREVATPSLEEFFQVSQFYCSRKKRFKDPGSMGPRRLERLLKLF